MKNGSCYPPGDFTSTPLKICVSVKVGGFSKKSKIFHAKNEVFLFRALSGNLVDIQGTFALSIWGEYLYSQGILWCGKIPVVPVIVMGGRYNITNVYIKQYTYAYDIFTSFQPRIAKNIRQRHKYGSQFLPEQWGGGILNLQLDSFLHSIIQPNVMAFKLQIKKEDVVQSSLQAFSVIFM